MLLAHAGIPGEAEYVQLYCQVRGIQPPSPQDWAFFVALGIFRLAAILAGVGARARQGNASSARAAEVSRLIGLIRVLLLPRQCGGPVFHGNKQHQQIMLQVPALRTGYGCRSKQSEIDALLACCRFACKSSSAKVSNIPHLLLHNDRNLQQGLRPACQ